MSEEAIADEINNTSTALTDTNADDSKNDLDPELFSCLLQPAPADSDPQYIAIRRLLLYRKAQSGVRRRIVSSLYLCNVPEIFYRKAIELR